MGYRVKEVSALAGVSIRTLHHFDAIGLLKPDHVTEAGYRLYSEGDLLRLQQILMRAAMHVYCDALAGGGGESYSVSDRSR